MVLHATPAALVVRTPAMQSICRPRPLHRSNVVLCPLSLHLPCLCAPPRHPPPPPPHGHSHRLLAPHPGPVPCLYQGPVVHRCALSQFHCRRGPRQHQATKRLGQGKFLRGDCFSRRPCILRTLVSTAIIRNHFTISGPMGKWPKLQEKFGTVQTMFWHIASCIHLACPLRSWTLHIQASVYHVYPHTTTPGAASKSRNVTVLVACAAEEACNVSLKHGSQDS